MTETARPTTQCGDRLRDAGLSLIARMARKLFQYGWGAVGDIHVHADYDGDGKTDSPSGDRAMGLGTSSEARTELSWFTVSIVGDSSCR